MDRRFFLWRCEQRIALCWSELVRRIQTEWEGTFRKRIIDMDWDNWLGGWVFSTGSEERIISLQLTGGELAWLDRHLGQIITICHGRWGQ